MKKIILHSIFIALSLPLFSQSNNDTIPLKDMLVPSSPVFNLLDITPTTTAKPATVKALALSVVNTVSESNGIPKNFAMEFAPFWLFKHPKMSIFKYNGLKFNAVNTTTPLTFKQNIFFGLRNTSLSIASVFKDSSKSVSINTNYIGYSIKTNFINVRKRKVLDNLHKNITGINVLLVNSLIPAVDACNKLFNPDSLLQEYNKCIHDFTLDSLKKIDSIRNIYDTLLTIRPVFTTDIALASSTAFANNNFKNNHSYRSGGWITFCYSQPLLDSNSRKTFSGLFNAKNYINIYGFFRILSEDSTRDFKSFTNQKYIDYGGRVEFEFDRLAISFELVHRNVSNHSDLNSSRKVGILQYRINDNFYLTGTFGKNFGSANNLVAFLGVNFAFGKTSLYNKLQSQ